MTSIWGQFHKEYLSHQLINVAWNYLYVIFHSNLPEANELRLLFLVVFWCNSISHIRVLHNLLQSHRSSDKPREVLQCRHNGRDSVSNHQPHDYLLNRLFRRRSKKTPKLRVTGLCAGNSPGTGEFPAQMASYSENVSIWWRHHLCSIICASSNKYTWEQTKSTYNMFYGLRCTVLCWWLGHFLCFAGLGTHLCH